MSERLGPVAASGGVVVLGGGEASGPLFPPRDIDEAMFSCEAPHVESTQSSRQSRVESVESSQWGFGRMFSCEAGARRESSRVTRVGSVLFLRIILSRVESQVECSAARRPRSSQVRVGSRSSRLMSSRLTSRRLLSQSSSSGSRELAL